MNKKARTPMQIRQLQEKRRALSYWRWGRKGIKRAFKYGLIPGALACSCDGTHKIVKDIKTYDDDVNYTDGTADSLRHCGVVAVNSKYHTPHDLIVYGEYVPYLDKDGKEIDGAVYRLWKYEDETGWRRQEWQ